MSSSEVNFQLREDFGSTEKLAAFFDFSKDFHGDIDANNLSLVRKLPTSAEVADQVYTGCLVNQSPAFNTNKYTGIMMSVTSSSEDLLNDSISGAFLQGNYSLGTSNLAFKRTDLSLANMSVLVDFEFGKAISDGVIFGAFEKEVESVGGVNYTASRGFNVGITSRGHLFAQSYGSENDKILTLNSELSNRNIIGISSYGNSIIVSNFDYLSNSIDSLEMPVEENYIANTEEFYFGGSKTYFRSSDPDPEKVKTLDGHYLNNIAIFSGAVSPQSLYRIGSGLIGEITYEDAIEETDSRLAGFNETIVYKTGITGYEYTVTGTLEIATGREYISGTSATNDSTESKKEGERYYKYYTLTDPVTSAETFYKEEVGFLHPDYGNVYVPTGQEAYDTLGLRNLSSTINTVIIDQYTGQETMSINFYGKTPLTGTLNEVSGVVQSAVNENYVVDTTDAASGLSLTGNSVDFKKNFIYYLGER